MATVWHESIVTYIKDESPNTKLFGVKIQGEEIFNFKAGQFVTMDLPISDKRLKRWRSYSIASEPNEHNTLEFCIAQLEGGAGTRYLFEDLKVGDTIKFKGPDGAFYLPAQLENDLVFICTGTGVAPFRSMIRDLVAQSKAFRKIHVVFGTRYKSGILYAAEWQQLMIDYPDQIQFSVALSRESVAGTTQGYVHGVYKKMYPTPRADVAFYICGWSAMIDEAVATLMVDLGYDKRQIHYELYG